MISRKVSRWIPTGDLSTYSVPSAVTTLGTVKHHFSPFFNFFLQCLLLHRREPRRRTLLLHKSWPALKTEPGGRGGHEECQHEGLQWYSTEVGHCLFHSIFPEMHFYFFISRFWREISPDLIADLNKPWSYRHDLDMLGYTPQQYFTSIGLWLWREGKFVTTVNRFFFRIYIYNCFLYVFKVNKIRC